MISSGSYAAKYPPVSAMTCTAPEAPFAQVKPMLAMPELPTGAITWFEIVDPAAKARFVVAGCDVPFAQTVNVPEQVGAVTARLMGTALTPLVGIPVRPVSVSAIVLPEVIAPVGAPVPVRVSSVRAGANAVYAPLDGDPLGLVKYPATSTTMWDVHALVPQPSIRSVTLPAADNRAMTVLPIVCPELKLINDAFGTAVPVGNALVNPAPVGVTMVTFR